MVIRTDRLFSFFALSLLGPEFDVRVVEVDGVVDDYYLEEVVVDDIFGARARVRLMADLLNTSIVNHFGNPEVDAWLKELGGMRALNQHLAGRAAYKQYIHDLREIKAEDGFLPVGVGERQEVLIDTATGYDGYAVEVHRDLLTKAAYGEIEEDQFSDPSWEGHEGNINSTWVGGEQKVIRPYWWDDIFIGRFRVGKQVKEPKSLVQTEGSKADWLPDIRVSDVPFGTPFKHITEFAPWYICEEDPQVREFQGRFYRDPNTLIWGKVGHGDKERWAAAMKTRSGKFMWSPLSHDSSSTMGWRVKQGDKPYEARAKRCLTWGPWVVVYFKTPKQSKHITYILLKEDGQTGWLAKWKTETVHFTVWGAKKKDFLAKGAKDTWFGLTPSVEERTKTVRRDGTVNYRLDQL